jgi:hypothetical protein
MEWSGFSSVKSLFLFVEEKKLDDSHLTNAELGPNTTDGSRHLKLDQIILPSQESETSNQVICANIKKDSKTISKDRILNPKKRKLAADKNKEAQEKEEKTRKKEPKQSKQENKSMAGSGSDGSFASVNTKITKKRVKKTKKAVKRLTDDSDFQALEETDAKMPESLDKPALSGVNCEKESRRHEPEEKASVEDIQTPETTPFGPATKPCSPDPNFANMPKLVKASFKPPSKKGREESKYCSKPTKMPKLWKPQFICPAVAAEKASNLLKGNKKEQFVQSVNDKHEEVAMRKVEQKRINCDDGERCSIDAKKPLLQPKNMESDPVLSGKRKKNTNSQC